MGGGPQLGVLHWEGSTGLGRRNKVLPAEVVMSILGARSSCSEEAEGSSGWLARGEGAGVVVGTEAGI